MALLELAQAIAGFFAAFRSLSESARRRRREAIDALSAACTETAIYVAALDDGAARDRQREEDLVRAWRRASVPVRAYDHDLADRCELKAGFWLRPDDRPEEEIAASRIELERVTLEARQLRTLSEEEYARLKPKGGPKRGKRRTGPARRRRT